MQDNAKAKKKNKHNNLYLYSFFGNANFYKNKVRTKYYFWLRQEK